MSGGIRALSSPEWQPIETAPKDGEIILLFVGWVAAGCWMPDDHADRWPWKFFDTDSGRPIINGSEHGTLNGPSHWAPLPLGDPRHDA